jgi:AcrR family transcriptional regulator
MTQPPNDRPPPAVELAWGLRGRARRGPKPGRSLDEVVAATVRIADTEGIEAVSMQRVAAELGFTTMALYRYVPSKDDLVSLALDAASVPVPDVPQPGDDWRAGLERWARAHDAQLRRHPWILHVPITGPPIGPNQVAWMESCLRCMAEIPLTSAERYGVLNLLSGFVLNHRRLYDQLERSARESGTTLAQMGARYGELLARLLDPTRFPHVRDVFAGTDGDGDGLAPEGDDAAADLEFGLARILDGVAHLLEGR